MKLQIPAGYLDDVREAVRIMKQGGVILYPTDTIWGLGCDARNPEAVRRIYDIKQRVDSKALICLVDNEARLEQHVEHVPDIAWQLIDCADSPLTVIYDHGRGLAPNLLADDGSVGLRLTRELFSMLLCQHLGGAVVSTSANISGQPAPKTFRDIAPAIKDAVDYVCRSRRGERTPAAPSHIVKLTDSGIVTVIR
ncbi:MAG: threonylcarbamoyl-AMP synthase [Bacteroidaceae bacterium]|nr:threonylcarbamoyl-AMP synthase [Bacteroidaceae bacterium]